MPTAQTAPDKSDRERREEKKSKLVSLFESILGEPARREEPFDRDPTFYSNREGDDALAAQDSKAQMGGPKPALKAPTTSALQESLNNLHAALDETLREMIEQNEERVAGDGLMREFGQIENIIKRHLNQAKKRQQTETTAQSPSAQSTSVFKLKRVRLPGRDKLLKMCEKGRSLRCEFICEVKDHELHDQALYDPDHD